tara:strand:+ start:953 stop:1138 length:186 start_codon:yes stop_codon:yes gene_type:complete
MKNTILILSAILFIAMMPLECVSVDSGNYAQISFNYFQLIGLVIVYLFWELLKKINNDDEE